MKKPLIAVDIDDVLFPFIYGIAEHHNNIKGTTLTLEDFVSYNLNEVWGCSQEEANQIIKGFLSKNYLHLEPVQGAQAGLYRLKKDFKVVLVTARNSVYEPETSRWLQVHLPGLFDELIFSGNIHDGRDYRSKGEICEELGAVLIIDDHPDNILSAAQRGVEGILFGEKAWTVMDELPASLVKPCKDWDQVERYIYGEWQSKQLS